MPDSQMDQMGLQAFANLKKETPISKQAGDTRYVRCVAEAITREVGGEWEVVVFEEGSPNAFALPGGKIGVHTGLLKVAENQDQLASVLGHEVGHVLAKHSNERVSHKFAVQQGLSLAGAIAAPQTAVGKTLMGLMGAGAQVGILLPFSRTHESEADLIGLDLMAKAGFDPRESVQLWTNMGKAGGGQTAEFLSTHPSHNTRIQDLEKRMPLALEIRGQARAAGKKPQCGG